MSSVLKSRWQAGTGTPRQRPTTRWDYRTDRPADSSTRRKARPPLVSPKAAYVQPQTAQQGKRNSAPVVNLVTNDLVRSPEEFNFEDFVPTDNARPPSRQGPATGNLIDDPPSSAVQRLPIKALPVDRPPSRKKLPPGGRDHSYRRRNLSCDEFYEVLSEDSSEPQSRRTNCVLDADTPLHHPTTTKRVFQRRHRSKAPVLLNRREKVVRRIMSREAKLQEAYDMRESEFLRTAQLSRRPPRKFGLNSSLEPGFLKLFASKH